MGPAVPVPGTAHGAQLTTASGRPVAGSVIVKSGEASSKGWAGRRTGTGSVPVPWKCDTSTEELTPPPHPGTFRPRS
jgi:hypothetical protein